MPITLLTTGLLCVIAAIVGGGVEALGGKVPVIQSSKRQLALGIFGIVLLLSAYVSSPSNIVPGPDQRGSISSGNAPQQLGSDSSQTDKPDAEVSVTGVSVEPVNQNDRELLRLQGLARITNIGKVHVTAGCPEASAILTFWVPGPQGPQIATDSWRLLGQQHYTPGQSCKVDLAVGESKTFPILIPFDKPSEDAVSVNLMVQFHRDAIPFGTKGRNNARVWADAQRIEFHRSDSP